MTSMREFVVSDQRLLILRSLREMTGCSANESILDECLEAYGHSISRDAVRTQMRWLEEQGLVAVEEAGSVLVATLRERGAEVAAGRARVDGVKRPGA